MNRVNVWLICLVALCAACHRARADGGLVLEYNFGEGAGSIVHDSSGRGNDGTIRGGVSWVKGMPYSALSFNGKDGCVEGPLANLPIGPTGTLEFWCYPRTFGGGLIGWCSDGVRRLALAYDIFFSNRLEGDLSDGKQGLYLLGDEMPADVVNRWSHMVLRFDPHMVEIFRNGKLDVSRPSYFTPDLKGAPLRIGASDYPRGLRYFDGLMSGVKIYNRALGDSEIAADFARGAHLYRPELPRALTIVPRFDPAHGRLVVAADLSGLTGLPLSGYSIEAQLSCKATRLQAARLRLAGGQSNANLAFSAHDVAVATYDIKCTVRDTRGRAVVASSVRWKLPKLGRPGSHVLNNLVAALLTVRNLPPRLTTRLSFNNPRRGWVFVSCTAALNGSDAVRVAVDGAVPGSAIQLRAGGTGTGETMCFLPEGPGAMQVECTGLPLVQEIVARSIPELILCNYWASDPPDGKINRRGSGDYNFKFLQHEVLPNINTLVADYGGASAIVLKGNDPSRDKAWFDEWNQFDRWRQSGRRWIQDEQIPNLRTGSYWESPNSHYLSNYPITADQVFGYWTRSQGFTDPDFSGLFADEIPVEQGLNAPKDDYPYVDNRYLLPPYTDAMRRMAADPKYKDRCVYVWGGACARSLTPNTRGFVQAILDADYKYAWEQYMSQPPTPQDGRDMLYAGPSGWAVNNVRLDMERGSAHFPGLVEHLVYQPGVNSMPGMSHLVDPNLDLKVWMDMQMQYLATAPEFFGLDGISWYIMSTADEEDLRWAGQLFRHYAIDGKTDLLSPSYGFKWKPGIIENADFDSGLQGWTVHAAEPGSVSTGAMDDLGLMEGRMRRNDMGRHFILTQRSALGPNTVSQALRHLVPGKLYSAKLLGTDYQCYLKDLELPERSARLSIDGAEVIPEKSYVARFQSYYGSKWFDAYRVVFRAKSPTARLTISDWKADGVPGGPVGQQQLFNFVAVAPYFD